jgi:hypothetical protein
MILLEVALNNKVSLRRAENTTYYCIITLLGTTTVETLKIYMHNVFVRRTTSKYTTTRYFTKTQEGSIVFFLIFFDEETSPPVKHENDGRHSQLCGEISSV